MVDAAYPWIIPQSTHSEPTLISLVTSADYIFYPLHGH